MPTCKSLTEKASRAARAALVVATATVALAPAPRAAIAQTCPAMDDPVCVPTATCDRYGNDPARYDAAEVAVVPECVGGTRLGPVPDRDGTPRYACLYEPISAPSGPLPLVVYLHPSIATADSAWQVTNLVPFVQTANVSDDSSRRGFILLAPEGRKTCHYYPEPDRRQTGWDNWYRNLNPCDPEENVDAATIDHFVDEQIARGVVDENRIFATGWSNGAAMAYLWGLMRPSVAAIAVFSAPNPFRAMDDPCPQVPVAKGTSTVERVRILNAGVPTMHVHNDCDIIGLCPNGELLARQLLPLGIGVQDAIIDSALLPANGCQDACGTDPDASADPCSNPGGTTVGVGNHVRWPLTWTASLVDFFRAHPLGARAKQRPARMCTR
ncbi:MAG TPA: PHB depolymerase family esterase [Candidatus Binatia bacterium]|nr:PHB depolymerase family esterase [Candidatus Binatia bacterium]